MRCPRQDDHACRFLATTTGAVVISVDYDTAPSVKYPLAEHQAYDVFDWIRRCGDLNGWDATRITVGGFSAGAKLAINVCQQARDRRVSMPLALVASYPALNMTLAPTARRLAGAGANRAPAVAPWLIRLMYDTYFVDEARRSEVLASPELDDNLSPFPPTLLLIGGRDSLAPEANRFAQSLLDAGVTVQHERFEDSDHGLTHNLPIDVARKAFDLIGAHLSRALSR